VKIIRVPLRISLVGGGTDRPEFYKEHGPGCVVSMAINKYIYITYKPCSPLFPHKFRLAYSKLEVCNTVDEIQHPIIREVFREQGITSADLDVISDVPAGTGLGSSSAFTVGLYKALGVNNKQKLIQYAFNMEHNVLKEPVGLQDHAASVYGDFRRYYFTKAGVVESYKIRDYEPSALLLRLPGTRSASQILEQADFSKPEYKSLSLLAQTSFDVSRGWELKKQTSPVGTWEIADNYISRAIRLGATAGKLLGAGSSGFIYLEAPQSAHYFISKELGLQPVGFKIDKEGAKTLYESD
jgi:D-glycero-alpha-D-manno-heptose-7-phosphate kinase